MRQFDFEDELILLDGIRKGLGEQWLVAQRWVKVHARGDVVDVFLEPPSRKQMFRNQQVVLAEVPEGTLESVGRVVGFDMARYLNKHRRYIEPSALD
jgi:hypothetical protein